MLDEAAGDRTLSSYFRWLAFKDKIPLIRTRGKKPVKDYKKLAQLLAFFGKSRIANNINQLAKAANSGSLPVNIEMLNSLNEAVKTINWIRTTLIQALGLQETPSKKEGHRYDPKSQ